MLHQLRARVEKRRRSVAHVEFRSRAVEISQICIGLAPAPSFLRAICSIPSFGIAKFDRGAFGLAIPAKIPAKWTGCSGLMLGFSIRRDSFPGKAGIELAPYVIVITTVFSVVPLAGIEPALLAELDFESSASTSSATGAFAFPLGIKSLGRRSGRNIAGASRGSTRADVISRRLDRLSAAGYQVYRPVYPDHGRDD
jgi:hypothetical protein